MKKVSYKQDASDIFAEIRILKIVAGNNPDPTIEINDINPGLSPTDFEYLTWILAF